MVVAAAAAVPYTQVRLGDGGFVCMGPGCRLYMKGICCLNLKHNPKPSTVFTTAKVKGSARGPGVS